MTTDIARVGEVDPSVPVGLEDYEPSGSLPRVKILHKLGMFEAPDTSRAPGLVGVLLGAVVRRTLFQVKLEDGAPVRCKSTDGTWGFPTTTAEKAKWNLDLSLPGHPPVVHADGRQVFNCKSCVLSKWQDDDAPACHKSYEVPLMFSLVNPGDPMPDVDDLEYSAILTVKKTWLAKFGGYVDPFSRNRRSLFTAMTRITLSTHQRGDNVYSLPEFSRVGATDEALHSVFTDNFRSVAEFLRRPPRGAEDSQDDGARTGAVVDAGSSEDPWADSADSWESAKPAAADWPGTPPPPSAPPTPPPPPTPPAAAAPAAPAQPAAPAAAPPAAQSDSLSGHLSDDEIPF